MARRTRRLARWKLALFSALVGLALLELGLRLVLGNFAQSKILQRSELPGVCLELRADAELTYTGWQWRVPATTMRTNEHHARGPSFAPVPQPGVLRVAAVGDSFVFGQGVEQDEAFVSVLERSLRDRGVPAELLNFGVPGHATPQEVAHVRHRIAAFQPDLVVLHVFVNDLTAEESYCEYGEGDSELAAWFLQNSTVFRAGFFASKSFGHGPGGGGGVGERFVASLKELAVLGQQKDFLVAVVLLTDRGMFERGCWGCPVAHDLVPEAGVHAVDLGPVWSRLQGDVDRYFIPKEGHFSIEGSAVVGQELADRLLDWPELTRRVVRVRREGITGG